MKGIGSDESCYSIAVRKAHFLGAKIKKLSKDNGLTLDDLSVRCV